MYTQLPNYATDESHKLLQFGHELISEYPQGWSEGILATGSAAFGRADKFSDLDMHFFSEALQTESDYQDWLQTLDVKIVHQPIRINDFESRAILHYKQRKVECVWTTWEGLEDEIASLRALLLDENAPLKGDFQLFHAFSYGFVFHGEQALEKRIGMFNTVPPFLRKRIIQAHIDGWRDLLKYRPLIASTWAHSARGAYYDQNRRKRFSLDAIIEVLFFFNNRFPSDPKWINAEFEHLEYLPENVIDRIHECIHTSGYEGIRLNYMLVRDLMSLLATEFDVENVITSIDKLLAIDVEALLNDPDIENLVTYFHVTEE